MRFRWKLVFWLLLIALLPIAIMRLSGVKFVRHMADELTRQVRENRIDNMQKQLRLLVDSYAKVLNHGRSQIETALLFQADGVERALAGPAGDSGRIYLNAQFNAGIDLPPDTMASPIHFYTGPDEQMHTLQVSYSTQVFKLAPGHDTPGARSDMVRLAALTPLYAKISKSLDGMAFWQYTSLSNGLHGAYPAHSGFPPDMIPTEQPWYAAALENSMSWSDPYVDPATRQVVLAATRAVKGPDGKAAGATAIVIPVSLLLDQRLLFKGLTSETVSFMVYMAPDPQTGQRLPRIFARDEYTDVKFRSWRAQVDQGWLGSEDKRAYDGFLSDLVGGTGGLRRMAFEGRDSLWVYGPTQNNAFLVLITPYSAILEPAREAKLWVQALIDQLISYTGYGIGVVIFIDLILALTFSQSVTRPLGVLMQGVQALARGDFNTRVQIDSKDEFGDLGRVFNSLGPRLKEHDQMRQALVLAKQVQQRLLPSIDPHVPGLDLAGRCVFCDDIGGDYYDYLTGASPASAPLTIVVGDVCGHGLPSGLLMATARALLRQRASQGGAIADIMSDVNQQLNLDVEASGQFMTMFYARIDPSCRTVQWVRAGHEPGVIYDPVTDRFIELEGKGIPLGAFRGTTYTQYENSIGPGQILVLGTDGIRESVNVRGEMFGKGAFYDTIRAYAHLPAGRMLDAVVSALERFRYPAEQKDDITLVVAKVMPVCVNPKGGSCGGHRCFAGDDEIR